MNFKEPKEDDWKNYKENITVWRGLNGKCGIEDIQKCPDTNIAGGQKKVGNCGDCDYFMGHISVENWQLGHISACCWALEQLL